jgi:uncharacterized phage protein (TIGR01671 family)
MREHKYRAWDNVREVMVLDNDYWLPVDYKVGPDKCYQCTVTNKGILYLAKTNNLDMVEYTDKEGHKHQYHSNVECLQLFENKNQIQIMQLTGLKDKNEKEIYEGDIVEVTGQAKACGEENRPLCVIWNPKSAAFVLAIVWEGEIQKSDATRMYGRTIKIIGNIHESPELLTDDKKSFDTPKLK